MITPTIGRVVWYHPPDSVPHAQPFAAIVAHVWSDTCVNLAYFDANGLAHNATSVLLVQDGSEVPAANYCEWMPYQKLQAEKHAT